MSTAGQESGFNSLGFVLTQEITLFDHKIDHNAAETRIDDCLGDLSIVDLLDGYHQILSSLRLLDECDNWLDK